MLTGGTRRGQPLEKGIIWMTRRLTHHPRKKIEGIRTRRSMEEGGAMRRRKEEGRGGRRMMTMKA
jgi:hypothetical protein